MTELLDQLASSAGRASGATAGPLLLVGAAIAVAAVAGAGFRALAGARREPVASSSDVARRGLGTFVRPYRFPLVVSAALTLCLVALDLAAPWPLKLAVDHAIGREPLEGWLAPLAPLSPPVLAAAAALAGVALVALGGALRYLTSSLVGAASAQIVASLQCATFDRLMHLPLRVHARHRTGDLVARIMSDAPRVQDALIAAFNTLIPSGLTLLGMLAVLFALDVRVALAALAVLPALAAQILLSRERITVAERDVRERSGALASRATEVVRHVRAIQAFSREREEKRSFRDVSAGATRSAARAGPPGAVLARVRPHPRRGRGGHPVPGHPACPGRGT